MTIINIIDWDEAELALTLAGESAVIGLVDITAEIEWDESGDWSITSIDVLSAGERTPTLTLAAGMSGGGTDARMWTATAALLMASKKFRAHVEDNMPEELAAYLADEYRRERDYQEWQRL